MSKKIVFKGVVNGKEFDNVADYNKAITDAVSTGAELNCSTETHYEEDDSDTCGDECTCCKKEPDMYPSYDPDLMENTVLKDSKNLSINELGNKLAYKLSPCIINAMGKMAVGDLNEYIEDLENCLDSLAETAGDIKDITDESSAQIEDLKKQIKELTDHATATNTDAQKVKLWKVFYDGLLDAAKKTLELKSDQPSDKPVANVKETAKVEELDRDALFKLVKEIFG